MTQTLEIKEIANVFMSGCPFDVMLTTKLPNLAWLGHVLENFVRVSTFNVRRIKGRHREIVPCPAAQSRHCIGGDVPHIQPLLNGLKISSRCGAVIHAVTT